MGKRPAYSEQGPAYLDIEVLAGLSPAALDDYMKGFPEFTPAAEKKFQQQMKAARARHAAEEARQAAEEARRALAAAAPPAAPTVQPPPAVPAQVPVMGADDRLRFIPNHPRKDA